MNYSMTHIFLFSLLSYGWMRQQRFLLSAVLYSFLSRYMNESFLYSNDLFLSDNDLAL